MHDFFYQVTDQFFLLRRKHIMALHLYQKITIYMFLKTKDAIKESQYSTKTKYFLLIHSPGELIFEIQQAVLWRSENSHKVVQLNPDEDKNYFLALNPTLMQPPKKFLPESIRAIARNSNINSQSIGIYSKSDLEHHIRTQKNQEKLTKMDTIQRNSIDQNLSKLAETEGFSDIYAQDYTEYFKDIKDYIHLNGEKNRPQDISPKNNFSFVKMKNDFLAFLGWPYYILERLAILNAMFNFLGFLFSLKKVIYNTCAIHTQVNKRGSVAQLLFAGFFVIFSTSMNEIFLDAQIKEYNTKLSTTPETYDDSHNNTNPQLQNLNHKLSLSLVPRNFRNCKIRPNSTK